ncbi:MAG: RrF2 family transcriptional regulator [Solirubrobacteraceae bacterium]
MFSTKSEYGVRVMVELARRAEARGGEEHEEPVVSLAEIAEHDNMPLAYLEHLVARLRKAGLVDSRRGARGGYLLARPADAITTAEIIQALEGSIAPIECISLGDDGTLTCSRETGPSHRCPTKLLWAKVHSSIVRTLLETTLHDLLHEQHVASSALDGAATGVELPLAGAPTGATRPAKHAIRQPLATGA